MSDDMAQEYANRKSRRAYDLAAAVKYSKSFAEMQATINQLRSDLAKAEAKSDRLAAKAEMIRATLARKAGE